jgi:hypothetical protein
MFASRLHPIEEEIEGAPISRTTAKEKSKLFSA